MQIGRLQHQAELAVGTDGGQEVFTAKRNLHLRTCAGKGHGTADGLCHQSFCRVEEAITAKQRIERDHRQ
ncbi:hypothetical protein D3C72_2304180 [compost metagenome]